MSEPILHRVAAGDTDAVRECVSRYGRLVWSIARRMFHDPAEAEDAVQEVFIQLWKKAEQFDASKANESTFVGVLARRRMIDLLRQKKRSAKTTSLDAFDVGEATVDHLEQADEARLVKESWGELVPDQQAVLSLSIYDGLSYSQIAERLSLPLGTVKTRARLGLRTLREKVSSLTRIQETPS